MLQSVAKSDSGNDIPTPAELVERARAFRSTLRDQQGIVTRSVDVAQKASSPAVASGQQIEGDINMGEYGPKFRKAWSGGSGGGGGSRGKSPAEQAGISASVALDKARQLAENRGVKLDCVEADVLAYQPESAAYDLVLLAYLQLPQDEMAGVLHRAVAALAPGGTFLLVAHDLRNLTEGVGGPQDPTVLYTPEIIAAELTGLRITTAKTVRRDVSTDTGQRRAVDTLVRAVRPA